MSVMTEEEMDYQIELAKLYSNKNDNAENLYEFTESELSAHDEQIRADERKKAEQDFQNSDYWNEYLEKVIADARADAIDEYKIALHTKYKENKDFAYSVWEGNIYKFDAMANLDLEEIDVIAEQLKVRK